LSQAYNLQLQHHIITPLHAGDEASVLLAGIQAEALAAVLEALGDPTKAGEILASIAYQN